MFEKEFFMNDIMDAFEESQIEALAAARWEFETAMGDVYDDDPEDDYSDDRYEP